MPRVASHKSFNDEFLALKLDLSEDEIRALWTLAGEFSDIFVMIPQPGKWIILRIENGHITGKERRRA